MNNNIKNNYQNIISYDLLTKLLNKYFSTFKINNKPKTYSNSIKKK